MVEYPMTCHSGGTLEIYVEPYLPHPMLILVVTAVIERWQTFAAPFPSTPSSRFGAEEAAAALRSSRRPRGHASVVVATHADSDEDALQRILATEAGYVAWWPAAAGRRDRRAPARGRRPLERLARLKAPAGLDIGAVSPTRIAVSILAEIIQHRRTAKAEPSGGGNAGRADRDRPDLWDERRRRRGGAPLETSAGLVYFCCRTAKTSSIVRARARVSAARHHAGAPPARPAGAKIRSPRPGRAMYQKLA